MAKAISSGKNKPEQEDEQKTRKKHAKKEAKLMVQIEQSKKDVRKAEQKANKAQAVLQDLRAHLQNLEGELIQFRNGSQEAPAETVKAEPATSTAPTDLQTSSSLPAEGKDDVDALGAANSEANTTTEVDNVEVQPSSPPPVEGRSDIAQEDATSSPVVAATTPIENIATEQSDEAIGAQVHADISINPAPTEDDLTISSGDGSIPVVTSDENAWPPPQIREELAESIAQDVAQEHATDDNGQSKADESDAENHNTEHETSRPHRSTRRKSHSSAQTHTDNQE